MTAPTANAASAVTAEDTAVAGTLSASDVEGSTLTFTQVTGPAHGTLVLNTDGTYTYTPAANYFGADSFTYKVNDGTTDSAVATVSLTVTSVNDAPTANAASAVTAEDTAVAGTLSGSDVEGSTLTFTQVTGPAHGTLVLNTDGTYTYTPAANYFGADSFTYKVNDGTTDSAVATVSLTVTSVNDAPTANAASAVTAEDTAVAGTLSASDVEGSTLTFTQVTGPAHGALVLNIDGTYTYTPAANYFGPDSFTYKVNDGATDSAVATVSLTVTTVNDAPTANAATAVTAEDTAVAGTLSASDIEGSTLTFSQVTGPAHGSLVLNTDGTYTYTPAANYFGGGQLHLQGQ